MLTINTRRLDQNSSNCPMKEPGIEQMLLLLLLRNGHSTYYVVTCTFAARKKQQLRNVVECDKRQYVQRNEVVKIFFKSLNGCLDLYSQSDLASKY